MTGRSGVLLLLLLWLCGRPLWPAKNGSICISCAPGPSESFQSRVIPITCYIKMDLILTISSTCHAEFSLSSRFIEILYVFCWFLVILGCPRVAFWAPEAFLSYFLGPLWHSWRTCQINLWLGRPRRSSMDGWMGNLVFRIILTYGYSGKYTENKWMQRQLLTEATTGKPD